MPPSVAEGIPRVRFVVNSLALGGAERHLCELILRGVSARRFHADVVCLKERGAWAADLSAAGIAVDGPWLRHRFDITAAIRLLRKGPVDVVYTHHGVNELLLGLLCRLVFGSASVAVVHATPAVEDGKHFSRAQRWLLNRATAIVAAAPSHRQLLIEHEKLPQRTTVIPYGIDHDRFRPCAAEAPAPTIGVVGSLLPEKGHTVLLEALPRVLASHPATRLEIIGGGPCEPSLREQAERLGIAQHVSFRGPRRDVEQLLPGLSVFTLPALPRRETFSIAALEAMSCGVPIVVSQVGSMADMLTDGDEGFLVPPGDATVLADRLRRVLDYPEQARRMGAAGRQRIEAHLTLDRMVARYSTLFEQLAGRRKSR